MNTAVLLYGQQRTFKYCFPSIKRLFKDILNLDFFVVINENNDSHHKNNLCDDSNSQNKDHLSINELDLLINMLNPIVYKKININNKQLSTYYKTNLIFRPIYDTISKNNFYYTSWEEYKKLPVQEKIFTVNECIDNNCILEKINNPSLSIFDLNSVEIYLRNIGLYYINLHKKKYTHIFYLRTDVIWFENYEQKYKIIKNKSVEDEITKNNILEFNNIIKNYDYSDLCDLIKQSIINNEEDIISLYFYNYALNLYCPTEHCGLFRIDCIIPTYLYSNINNIEEFIFHKMNNIIKLFLVYPQIGPGWSGELSQKNRHILYNNNISKNKYFHTFHALLRQKLES